MSRSVKERLMATPAVCIGEQAEIHTRMYTFAHTYARACVRIQTYTLAHRSTGFRNHTRSYVDTETRAHKQRRTPRHANTKTTSD